MYRYLRRVVLFSAQALIGACERMEKIDSMPDDRPDLFIDEDSASFALVGRGKSATRYQRYGLRGVPAAQVDVLMPLHGCPAPPIWLEIGEKAGRFDGHLRDRLTLRPVPPQELLKPITVGQIHVSGGDVVVTEGAAVVFERHYRLLDHAFDPADSARIVGYHYAHYFSHLRRSYDAEVQALMLSWRPSEGADKNRANREASRALYDLSRQLGWRKLSKDERERYGLPPDHPQWVRDEELVRILRGPKRTADYYASLTPAALAEEWEHR